MLSVWQPVAVNKSERPVLGDDEHTLYVKNAIGVYQGKLKILGHQNGRLYLTEQRIIFIEDAGHAIGLPLALVLRAEVVEKFLRSSPKVKLFLKEEAEPEKEAFVWTCMICLYSNSGDPSQPCVNCGVRGPGKATSAEPHTAANGACPKCTFKNHPLMRFCEMCGSELRKPSLWPKPANPLQLALEAPEEYTNGKPYVKLSFRKGGELEFFRAVSEQLDVRKWRALEERGGISHAGRKINANPPPENRLSGGGIVALQQQREHQRRRNEHVLSTSLADLDQLMYKAQDLARLTSSFGLQAPPSPALTLPPHLSPNLLLYHPELARHMSEFLLSHVLKSSTLMVTLPDFFALYNRHILYARGIAAQLVTTDDLVRCVELFEKLGLPVRLKQYVRLGLAVLTHKHVQLQLQLQLLIARLLADEEARFAQQKADTDLMDDYLRNRFRYFRGLTLAQISDHFGWAPLVCMEEVEHCMQEGLVVHDKHILGTFYFANRF